MYVLLESSGFPLAWKVGKFLSWGNGGNFKQDYFSGFLRVLSCFVRANFITRSVLKNVYHTDS